jgi:hypothetical protein
LLGHLHRLAKLLASSWWGLALAGLVLASCGDREPPVARLEIEGSPSVLAYPGYESVVLRWRVHSDSSVGVEAANVFVHWLDNDGNLVRTFDHAFPSPWRSGVEAEDEIVLFQSALGPPLAEGRYSLTAGLLDLNGERLPLETSGEHLGRYEYALAFFEVPASDLGVRFEFEGDWGPNEPGNDRQILGRRWLGREGSIIVRGGTPGDRVLAWLRIPERSQYQSRFVLDEGATVLEVQVSTPCKQEIVVISGTGLHRVEPRLGEKTDGDCRLDISSNFSFADPTREGEVRSAVLEVLSYRRE